MITQKFLIDYCYSKGGVCEKCRYTKYCDAYKEKYGDIPYEDDEYNPERYIREVIEIKNK